MAAVLIVPIAGLLGEAASALAFTAAVAYYGTRAIAATQQYIRQVSSNPIIFDDVFPPPPAPHSFEGPAFDFAGRLSRAQGFTDFSGGEWYVNWDDGQVSRSDFFPPFNSSDCAVPLVVDYDVSSPPVIPNGWSLWDALPDGVRYWWDGVAVQSENLSFAPDYYSDATGASESSGLGLPTGVVTDPVLVPDFIAAGVDAYVVGMSAYHSHTMVSPPTVYGHRLDWAVYYDAAVGHEAGQELPVALPSSGAGSFGQTLPLSSGLPGYREVGYYAPPVDVPVVPPYQIPLVQPEAIAVAPSHSAPRRLSGGRYHALVPPSPRDCERKVNVAGLTFALHVAHSATEMFDFVFAIYAALPWSVRRGHKNDTFGQRMRLLAANWHKVDVSLAVKNLLVNEVEDRIIGRLQARAQGGTLGAAFDRSNRYRPPVLGRALSGGL